MKAQINGLDIAYTDQGKGTSILLIHGYPLNKTMWEPQAKDLSTTFRVITVDLRGHGESSAPLWFCTMEMFADDLRALLEHLSVKKAVIAGFSMGGYVAFAFYRKYRDRVQGLVLADTRPQADSPEGKQGRFKTAQTAHKDGPIGIADGMLPKLLTPKTIETRPDLVQKARQIMVGTPVTGIAADLMAMAERPDSVPLLSEIQCPTLIIGGEEDGLTPPADAKLMAEKIKGAKLEIIPNAAHLSNLEQPEVFNMAVRKFLGSLS
jgi:pimeloyl-ACP methyl ester carboxylesterase